MKVQGFKPVPKTVDSEMGTITHEGPGTPHIYGCMPKHIYKACIYGGPCEGEKSCTKSAV